MQNISVIVSLTTSGFCNARLSAIDYVLCSPLAVYCEHGHWASQSLSVSGTAYSVGLKQGVSEDIIVPRLSLHKFAAGQAEGLCRVWMELIKSFCHRERRPYHAPCPMPTLHNGRKLSHHNCPFPRGCRSLSMVLNWPKPAAVHCKSASRSSPAVYAQLTGVIDRQDGRTFL